MGELRVPVKWGVTAVGFVDGGNVYAHPSTIDIAQMRGSIGAGIRWKSPLGPFRIDYGFKMSRQNIAIGVPESRGELWISFGQAF